MPIPILGNLSLSQHDDITRYLIRPLDSARLPAPMSTSFFKLRLLNRWVGKESKQDACKFQRFWSIGTTRLDHSHRSRVWNPAPESSLRVKVPGFKRARQKQVIIRTSSLETICYCSRFEVQVVLGIAACLTRKANWRSSGRRCSVQKRANCRPHACAR